MSYNKIKFIMEKTSRIWRDNTEYIIQEYVNGKSQVAIMKEFDKLSDTHIRNLLKEKDIARRSGGSYRSKVTKNYFEDPSDPNTQYWLGWIATDGNVYEKISSLNLYSNDLEVLENFVDWCGDPIAIYNYDGGKSIEYSIKLANKPMYNSLISLGITPKKSLTMEYLGDITWDFIRGVFEGDGSLIETTKRGYSVYSFRICSSSLKFISQVQNFLNSEGYECIYHINSDNGNPNYAITLRRISYLRSLFYKIYPTSVKYKLNRKYEKFQKVFLPTKSELRWQK